MRRVTVDSAVVVSSEPAVILQDIQDTGHLGKDEDARPLLLESGQQLVQDDQLARVLHNVLVRCVGWACKRHFQS